MKHPCRETKKGPGLPQTGVLAGVQRRELQLRAEAQQPDTVQGTVPRERRKGTERACRGTASRTHAGSKRETGRGAGGTEDVKSRQRRKVAQAAGGKPDMCRQEESFLTPGMTRHA